MQTYKAKSTRVRIIIVAICLILYLGLSIMVGFPLGFGTIMAQDIVKDYCNIIYPALVVK